MQADLLACSAPVRSVQRADRRPPQRPSTSAWLGPGLSPPHQLHRQIVREERRWKFDHRQSCTELADSEFW